MSEKEFAIKVRAALHDCHVLRIEMAIERGVPDMNVCYQGRECWVELKLFVKGRILLRPAQYAWSTRRSVAHQGRIFVVSLYDTDWVHVHKFPLSVMECGKYLAISSGFCNKFPLNELGKQLKISMFTC